MEDELDQVQRAEHLVDMLVPALGDVAMVDLLDEEGAIVRVASKSRGTKAAEAMAKVRAATPIDPDGPHPVAEAIRTGEPMEIERSRTARSTGSPPATRSATPCAPTASSARWCSP